MLCRGNGPRRLRSRKSAVFSTPMRGTKNDRYDALAGFRIRPRASLGAGRCSVAGPDPGRFAPFHSCDLCATVAALFMVLRRTGGDRRLSGCNAMAETVGRTQSLDGRTLFDGSSVCRAGHAEITFFGLYRHGRLALDAVAGPGLDRWRNALEHSRDRRVVCA